MPRNASNGDEANPCLLRCFGDKGDVEDITEGMCDFEVVTQPI